MADWPAYKGETLVQLRPDVPAEETVETLRVMLREARAASQRRLDRATKAHAAVRRHERTFRSQQDVIRRQGAYIEQLKFAAEIAADVVSATDEATRSDAVVALGQALQSLGTFRQGMRDE